MPFDDDDDGGASAAVAATAPGDEDSPAVPANLSAATNPDAGEDDEDGDDTQADFLKFAASLPGGGGGRSGGKKTATAGSKKTLRRGEKDFESHGTKAQVNVLEDSREAMGHVLGYTRAHKAPGHKDYLRGWYYPEWWAEEEDVQRRMAQKPTTASTSADDEGINKDECGTSKQGGAPQPDTSGMFSRDRVVVLESDGGSTLFRSTGRVFRGLNKDTPARSRMWLLPEEALYLVERGDLDLWWPYRPLPEMFPPESSVPPAGPDGEQQQPSIPDVLGAGTADYDLGLPLSLQAAYSLFIGSDGERGKVSLEKYQVYTNLRRTGYTVLRATSIPLPPKPPPVAHASIWQWLFSLVSASSQRTHHLPDGPLVKPGLYRSYRPIFEQQAIVQRHKPVYEPADTTGPPQDPFRIHYHVWKASGTFTKARPPPPDFQIAVADTRTSSVPTLEELTALLESTPWDPPAPPPPPRDGGAGGGGMNVGFMYKRLKHGWRNAIVAVVDRGLISYVRLTEMAFGEELLYASFDDKNKKGGGKRGGRGGGVCVLEGRDFETRDILAMIMQEAQPAPTWKDDSKGSSRRPPKSIANVDNPDFLASVGTISAADTSLLSQV
ncbi:hypothetical protein Micbo1qcDRAFT_191208 [Microdochium bolleyi]|uniref:tRNA-splicing endonuclease subunit Sen54 N-terminal domain-containing protein n=1 Tax=Microdochium bolleyi TaxID=196109 RepID=A0A136JH03_9PEZI|nr:hypothetical protein Micbo1qcDRAFT_191208 [Microdochium bolleyi]